MLNAVHLTVETSLELHNAFVLIKLTDSHTSWDMLTLWHTHANLLFKCPSGHLRTPQLILQIQYGCLTCSWDEASFSNRCLAKFGLKG